MHPEYPCAHCINAGAAAAVIEAVLARRFHPGGVDDQRDGAGVTPAAAPRRVSAEEVSNAAHLGRLPLSFFDRGGNRHGTAPRRIRCANRDAAGDYPGGGERRSGPNAIKTSSAALGAKAPRAGRSIMHWRQKKSPHEAEHGQIQTS